MSTQAYYTYRTPHGPMTIGVEDDAVCAVALGQVTLAGACRPTELSNRCATELLEYFAGRRTVFDVPLRPHGSTFQQEVWRAVGAVPYGQTRTNADIAAVVGNPAAFRAVGAAVRANPLAVLVPAHRVVGANGKPSGTGREAHLRAALLELERRNA